MAQHRRLELKLREMESKLELEQTSKGRLETQIGRLKEVIEGLNKDNENLRVREKATNDELRKMSKVMRDTKEELATKQGKDTEYTHKKLDFEKQPSSAGRQNPTSEASPREKQRGRKSARACKLQ